MLLLIWAVGVAAVLAGAAAVRQRRSDCGRSWRDAALIVIVALAWPLPAAIMLISMVWDLVCFLYAFLRMPH